MAETTLQYGINIVARQATDGAFNAVEQHIKDLDKAAGESQKIMTDNQQALAGMVGGMGGLFELAAKQLQTYAAGVKQMGAGLKEMVTSPFAGRPSDMLEQLFGGAGGMAGGAITRLGILFEPLGDMVANFGQAVGGVVGGVVRTFENMVAGIVRGAVQIGQALWEYAVAGFERLKAVAETALKVAGVGLAAFAALLAKAGQEAAEYQQMIRFAGAVTGLFGDDLREAEAQLANFGKELARTSTYTPTEAAQSFRVLASAGLDVNQILAASPGVVALAQSAMMDLDAASLMVTQTLKSFQLPATESTRIVNTFAAALGKSALESSDLSAALPYISAQAAAFKMPLEEMIAGLMALGNAGLRGSMAGTALRGVLTDLTVQGDKGQEILKKYGLTMESINPITQGFTNSVQRLKDVQLSEIDVMQIFGQRAGPGMLILLREGKEGLDKYTESIKGTNYAYQVMAEMVNTAQGGWKQLVSTTKEALISLGEGVSVWGVGVMGTLRETLAGLSESGAFSKIGEGIGAFIGSLFGGMEKLGPLLATMGERLVAFFEPERMKAWGAAVREWVDKLWKFATEGLPILWDWGVAVFSDIYNWLAEKVPEGLLMVSEGVFDLARYFIDLGETIEGVSRKAAGGFANFLEGLGLALEGVAPYLKLLGLGDISESIKSVRGGAEAAHEYAGEVRNKSSTGPRWIPGPDAEKWREKYIPMRQTVSDMQTKVDTGIGRFGAAAQAAGDVYLPGPADTAAAQARGREWADAMMRAAEAAMNARLLEWEKQKGRNTLRPAIP